MFDDDAVLLFVCFCLVFFVCFTFFLFCISQKTMVALWETCIIFNVHLAIKRIFKKMQLYSENEKAFLLIHFNLNYVTDLLPYKPSVRFKWVNPQDMCWQISKQSTVSGQHFCPFLAERNEKRRGIQKSQRTEKRENSDKKSRQKSRWDDYINPEAWKEEMLWSGAFFHYCCWENTCTCICKTLQKQPLLLMQYTHNCKLHTVYLYSMMTCLLTIQSLVKIWGHRVTRFYII